MKDASGTEDQRDAAHSTPGLRLLRTLRGHSGIIHRIAWSPKLGILASPSRDETVRIWDFQSGRTEAVLTSHNAWVNSVTWSPDGSLLASGTEGGMIFVWDACDWSLKNSFRAHFGRVECLHWSPSGEFLASASGDGTASVWRPLTGERVRRFGEHHAWVNAVAWSPDGRFLATGAEDPTVKVWNSRSFDLLHTLLGHGDWVTDVVWSPNSSLLASAADSSIRLWEPKTGRLIRTLTGHEGRVKCISFSADGRILASKGADQTVRLWRCDEWRQVAFFEEPTVVEVNPESNLAFHPSAPVLATLGENDRVVRIWSLDLDALVGCTPPTPEVRYRNAKVVLVGASSSGKTCLARALKNLPFTPQESTHGMRVWDLDAMNGTLRGGEIVSQEVFLWDLAGQADYQLVHQLFLDQAALVLIVFDPTDEKDGLASVEQWVRAVRTTAGEECPRLLVAGRVDRGRLPASSAEVNAFMQTHGLERYIETSAKACEGISDLHDAIRDCIRWDSLPMTHSPALWRDLKSYILTRRMEDNPVATCSDVKVSFKLAFPGRQISDRAFDSVVSHLQTQGLVWRLSFGDLVLLRPELLNNYASAVVLAARGNPEGLGSVVERDVLDARIELSAVERIEAPGAERCLLHAVVERFLSTETAIREGEHLIFPSKLNLPNPRSGDRTSTDTIYRFAGPIEQIYATLVVRLVYGNAFILQRAWRNGATFHDTLGRSCEVEIEGHAQNVAELSLAFEEATSIESRLLFAHFIHEHVHRRAIEDTVERERVYRCGSCGQEVRDQRAIAARIQAGKLTITCQFCESSVVIVDEIERSFAGGELLQRVVEVERVGREARNVEVGTTTASAKNELEEFDVFLAYNSADELTVESIAVELRRRGLNPWFAKWSLAPGRQFQAEFDRVFFSIGAVAAFFGSAGVGPWEDLEIRAAIQQFVRRSVPVIPVLLPGSPEHVEMPIFLREFVAVRFQQSIHEEDAIDRLQWGIEGRHPHGGPGPLVASASSKVGVN